jgi:hypothetical protein
MNIIEKSQYFFLHLVDDGLKARKRIDRISSQLNNVLILTSMSQRVEFSHEKSPHEIYERVDRIP